MNTVIEFKDIKKDYGLSLIHILYCDYISSECTWYNVFTISRRCRKEENITEVYYAGQ